MIEGPSTQGGHTHPTAWANSGFGAFSEDGALVQYRVAAAPAVNALERAVALASGLIALRFAAVRIVDEAALQASAESAACEASETLARLRVPKAARVTHSNLMRCLNEAQQLLRVWQWPLVEPGELRARVRATHSLLVLGGTEVLGPRAFDVPTCGLGGSHGHGSGKEGAEHV